jgi:triacylglycerol lipase
MIASAHAVSYNAVEVCREDGRMADKACYTTACTCNFLEALVVELPKSVFQTAIYTKSDGIVDWRVCRTGKPDVDFEVSATHIGMAFNPMVFDVVAHRLAGKTPNWGNRV